MRCFAPPIRKPDSKEPEKAQGPRAVQAKRESRLATAAGRGAIEAAARRNGLPARLRQGIEALSGIAMDDVRVHRHSSEPARFGALAFTRGSDIHLGSGQERHLPHEAWHVVQQKRGQVKATEQLNGAGLNAEEALEAEADRMGAAAATNRSTPPSGLRQAGASLPIVQRMVFSAGKWLTKLPGYSKVVKEHIDKPEKYQMRDNSCPDDEVVHLIDMSKKYLLGERHGSGEWERQTAFWSVPKMREGIKAMPREKDDFLGIFVKPVKPEAQPFESSHAFLVGACLLAQVYLNDVCSPRTKANFHYYPNYFRKILNTAMKWAKQIEIALPQYQEFAKRFDRWKKLVPQKPDLLEIHAFGKKCDSTYAVDASLLSTYLLAASVRLDQVTTSKKGKASAISMVQLDLDAADELRGFIPGMVAELQDIMDIPKGYESSRVAKAAAKDTERATAYEPLTAANPARERAMVTNLTAAAPPLLVQLGDAHVDNMAKVVKASVPIHCDAKGGLEGVTRRPQQ